jgi:endo-1,3(4)-beta-glucanase
LNQIASLSRAIETSKSSAAASKDAKEKGDGEEGKKKEPSVEDPIVPWEEIDVGIVVKVKGRVGRNWMGVMQVEVIKVEVLGCTDMEVRCWNEVLAFRSDVLGRPWVVEKEDEEKCLRRRERELRHLRKEGKSKKSEMDKDEVRRKRKELERKERHDEEVKRQKQEEIQDEGETNRRFNARNKINYPSLAVRRAAAGKNDALGI